MSQEALAEQIGDYKRTIMDIEENIGRSIRYAGEGIMQLTLKIDKMQDIYDLLVLCCSYILYSGKTGFGPKKKWNT